MFMSNSPRLNLPGQGQGDICFGANINDSQYKTVRPDLLAQYFRLKAKQAKDAGGLSPTSTLPQGVPYRDAWSHPPPSNTTTGHRHIVKHREVTGHHLRSFDTETGLLPEQPGIQPFRAVRLDRPEGSSEWPGSPQPPYHRLDQYHAQGLHLRRQAHAMANNDHWPLPTFCDGLDEAYEAKQLQDDYFLGAVGSPCSRSETSHLFSTLPHHGEQFFNSFGNDFHASGGTTDQIDGLTAWGSSRSNNGMALSDTSHSPRLPRGTESHQIPPIPAQAIAIQYGTNAFAPPSDVFGSGIGRGVYSGSVGTSASFQGADGSSFSSASSRGGVVEDDGRGGAACLSAFQAAGPQYHLIAGDGTAARPLVGSDGTLSPRDLHFQSLPSPVGFSGPQSLGLEDDGNHSECFALEPWHPAEKAVSAPSPASDGKGPRKSVSKPPASRLNSKANSKQRSARRNLPSKAPKTGRNSSSSKTETRRPLSPRRTSAKRLGLAPHRKVLPLPATSQPWTPKVRETTTEKQTGNNKSSWKGEFNARTADRTAKDEFLVKCKFDGMPYRQIRAEGNFAEAESTLRGRFRSLTKSKENRVRKPEWTDKDVKLLREAVGKLAREDNSGSPKIPWKQVASYIREKGGSYLFGNATCHKKWEELAEEIP